MREEERFDFGMRLFNVYLVLSQCLCGNELGWSLFYCHLLSCHIPQWQTSSANGTLSAKLEAASRSAVSTPEEVTTPAATLDFMHWMSYASGHMLDGPILMTLPEHL